MSTWPDGTPRSTGNAFDWIVKPVPLTREQLRLKKQAAYEKEAYTRRLAKQGRTRKDVQIKRVTRVNAEACVTSFIPKSVRAPR